MSTVSITMIGQALQDQFVDLGQQLMDATAEFHNDEVAKLLVANPGMTEACAMDVSYLRTRSRWSQLLEDRLIAEHKAGKSIMICDWPDHSDGNYDPFTGAPL